MNSYIGRAGLLKDKRLYMYNNFVLLEFSDKNWTYEEYSAYKGKYEIPVKIITACRWQEKSALP